MKSSPSGGDFFFKTGCETNFILLVIPDADVDTTARQFHDNLGDGRLTVMIGEEYLRLDRFRCLYQLVDCHCEWLVAGQEGDVDILDGLHLGDVLCVASNIDAQTVERKDITIVATLGMILCTAFRVVIGGYGLDFDIGGIDDAVAILQGNAVAEHVIDGHVRIDAGGRGAHAGDGLAVEMILMLMGDEDDVGLRELVVVGSGLYSEAYGVNLDLRAVVVDLDTGVLDARERDFLAVLGGKLVDFLSGLAASECHHCCDNQKQLFLHINGCLFN